MPRQIIALTDRKANTVSCGTDFCLGLGDDRQLVGSNIVDMREKIKSKTSKRKAP